MGRGRGLHGGDARPCPPQARPAGTAAAGAAGRRRPGPPFPGRRLRRRHRRLRPAQRGGPRPLAPRARAGDRDGRAAGGAGGRRAAQPAATLGAQALVPVRAAVARQAPLPARLRVPVPAGFGGRVPAAEALSGKDGRGRLHRSLLRRPLPRSGLSLSRYQDSMTILDGKATAETIRREVATRVAAMVDGGARPPGLAVVLVGDDPASKVYVGSKIKACEGRDGQPPGDPPERYGCGHPAPGDRRAERGRRDRRLPGPTPAAGTPPGARDGLAGRARKGRRRLPRHQRRPALAGRGRLRPGDPVRHRRAAQALRDPDPGCPRRHRRPLEHRRQADGGPPAAGERHRHRLPLAHARPARGLPRGRHPGRRHRPHRDDHAGHGAGRRRSDRRRHQPGRRPRRGRAALPGTPAGWRPSSAAA